MAALRDGYRHPGGAVWFQGMHEVRPVFFQKPKKGLLRKTEHAGAHAGRDLFIPGWRRERGIREIHNEDDIQRGLWGISRNRFLSQVMISSWEPSLHIHSSIWQIYLLGSMLGTENVTVSQTGTVPMLVQFTIYWGEWHWSSNHSEKYVSTHSD